MNELLQIVQGLKEELCTALKQNPSCAVVEGNFNRAIQLIVEEIEKQEKPEIQLAIARGKNEAFELALNALTRQKY